jgi:alkyl sulfatase BDS1-like metallo-beta-lactamase superfamily hydrolase
VLYVSENTTCTMHNIQTPRGALVRDANKWAGYITEQLRLWGDKVEALIAGHCWPRYGNGAVVKYLELQRDNYKFIHDQTVRRFNNGQTPTEIAEELKVPKAISDQWSNRGYYGTVKHNAKGVFQRYLGWWDGIPAHLDQLPTQELSTRYVRAMGGAQRVLEEAQRAMTEGEYRWAAQILNDLVFAEPDNTQAKALLADTYEQLGYQAESAIWRNYYLTGADELRGTAPAHIALQSPDMVGAMPMASFLDLLATRLNPDKIGTRTMTLTIDDGVPGNKSLVTLRNAVLVSEVGRSIDTPTVSVSGEKLQLVALFVRKQPLETMEAAGLKVAGDRAALQALLDALEPPNPNFPVVTP